MVLKVYLWDLVINCFTIYLCIYQYTFYSCSAIGIAFKPPTFTLAYSKFSLTTPYTSALKTRQETGAEEPGITRGRNSDSLPLWGASQYRYESRIVKHLGNLKTRSYTTGSLKLTTLVPLHRNWQTLQFRAFYFLNPVYQHTTALSSLDEVVHVFSSLLPMLGVPVVCFTSNRDHTSAGRAGS